MRDARAWLTTTVARICLDQLGSARARRETYVGPWLPEPAVGAGSPAAFAAAPLGPEDRVTLDESVSMAMLVLLESLSPAERTAFVLHEVLGLPYDEIAGIVGRSEAACRQLVTRARARVRDRAPRFTADHDQHAGVARHPVTGAAKVARLLLGVAARHHAAALSDLVNGSSGLVFEADGRVVGVMGFTVADNLITEIDFVVNPEKLRSIVTG